VPWNQLIASGESRSRGLGAAGGAARAGVPGITPETVEDFGPGTGGSWRLGQPANAKAAAMTATVLKSALMAGYPLAIAVGNVSMTIPSRAYANG
jgi:hypothetical protein